MTALDLNFFPRSRVPLVLQSEAAECGLACVAMIAAHHRHGISLQDLRSRNPVSLKGIALDGLMDAARCAGLEPRALRLECNELRQLRLPCVLHWSMNHFVVLERVSVSSVRIADPATGRRTVSLQHCSERFTGVALELLPERGFGRGKAARRLRLEDLLSGHGGLLKPLAQILAFSVALQVFALATPMYLQLVIDQVVLARDLQLLSLLALAFAAIAAAHAVTSAFRAWCVFYFGTRLNYGWTSALFSWLMRQPLGYFEKRSVGDIQSRFASIPPIRELISSRSVEIVVDGLMAATTGLVILFYGIGLATAVLLSITVYTAIRLSLFPAIARRSREQLVANAEAETFLLESIRGALTIKNFGIEQQRLERYRNRIVDAFNAAARVRSLSVFESSVELAVFSLQNIVVVYIGVRGILDAQMTVGMLVAFLAYSSQFSSRSINLVQGVLQFRLVRIHLDRIADIAFSVPEPAARNAREFCRHRRRLDGRVEIRNVWFRYDDDDRWILKDVSFSVAAGECVGISAPSGFGKTTLLKVMIGLLQPAAGESRYDDIELNPHNIHMLRGQFGIVMQQDRLLAGSVAQNIAAFDTVPDETRVAAAARIACIHNDISALPMGYLSLVGDMGDVFSGGQKQRILLARALYRRPRVLFLDEATSSLDSGSEQQIVTALRHLSMTRIVIAHRQETLSMCDRIIDLAALGRDLRAPLNT